MKTLVIYAHPRTDGHCPFIKDEVEKYLHEHKISYELIDLYAIHYDPILHESEHYTAGNRTVSDQNREFQNKISNTKKLIFIYPIWWNSMPAIMKGFFDRVFTSRWAFTYTPRGIPVKLLKGRKALVFLTSGSPLIIFKILFRSSAATIIMNDILGFCGIKTRICHIDNARNFTEKQKAKIRRKVPLALKKFYGDEL